MCVGFVYFVFVKLLFCDMVNVIVVFSFFCFLWMSSFIKDKTNYLNTENESMMKTSIIMNENNDKYEDLKKCGDRNIENVYAKLYSLGRLWWRNKILHRSIKSY